MNPLTNQGFTVGRRPAVREWRRGAARFASLVGPLVVAAVVAAGGSVAAADAQSALSPAPHGTPFTFEVIESHDAKYPGDTPGHRGKDGGLTVRPQVALGDPVYRTVDKTTTAVGKITLVSWDRVSGSLTVEFEPKPSVRIAVGDEVWVDLNPLPKKPDAAE